MEAINNKSQNKNTVNKPVSNETKYGLNKRKHKMIKKMSYNTLEIKQKQH